MSVDVYKYTKRYILLNVLKVKLLIKLNSMFERLPLKKILQEINDQLCLYLCYSI